LGPRRVRFRISEVPLYWYERWVEESFDTPTSGEGGSQSEFDLV